MDIEEKCKGLEDLVIWASAQRPTLRIGELKEYVRQMVRMLKQKTGGQTPYAKNGDIAFENLERVRMGILAGAVALVRSGALERIDCTGPMVKTVTPEAVKHEKHMKDRDWGELKIREDF